MPKLLNFHLVYILVFPKDTCQATKKMEEIQEPVQQPSILALLDPSMVLD